MSYIDFLLLFWTFRAVTDLYCVHGGEVRTNNQTGILGPNPVTIRCQFTIGTGESVDVYRINRKRIGENSYTALTGYILPNVTVYFDISVRDRTTLLLQQNAASIIFNTLECTDEAMYQCQFKVSGNGVVTTETAEMMLTVNVRPTSPIFTNGPPESRLFQENDTLNLDCTGEVGKPAGDFVWFTYRKNGVVIDKTSQAVHNPPYTIRNSCGFGRVSQLSITLSRLDNGLTVRCATDQITLGNPPTSNEQCNDTKCIQTAMITVQYSINQEDVVAIAYPDISQHMVGSTIRLTCTADGNPPPEFRWQKNGDENKTINADVWRLDNVQMEDSGTYTCYVSNTVDGKVYNASKSTNVIVVFYTTTTPTPSTTVKPDTTLKPRLTEVPPSSVSTVTARIIGSIITLVVVCTVVL